MDKILIYYKNCSEIEKYINVLNKSNNECAIFCKAYFRDGKIFLEKFLYFNESIYENSIVLNNIILLNFLLVSSEDFTTFPCIIHSHVKYDELEFSIDDEELEESCNEVLEQNGGNHLLMVLIGIKDNKILIHSKKVGLYEGELSKREF